MVARGFDRIDRLLAILSTEDRRLIAALILIPMAVGAVAFQIGIPMTSDPAWGFLSLEFMRHGAGFNYLVFPVSSNIAVDYRKFLTLWTPGQYLIPDVFMQLGLRLGASIVVTNVFFSTAGMLGWYGLYRTFGFSPKTIAISCLLMMFTQWFLVSINVYYGGENLLFGIAPWIAMLFWRLRRLRLSSALPLILAVLATAFIKLSGIPFALALLAANVLSGPFSSVLRRGVTAGIVIIVFGLVLYFGWMARGPTAATLAMPVREAGLSLISFAFPVVAPVASIFGFTNFLDELLLCPCRPGLPSPNSIIRALLSLRRGGLFSGSQATRRGGKAH